MRLQIPPTALAAVKRHLSATGTHEALLRLSYLAGKHWHDADKVFAYRDAEAVRKEALEEAASRYTYKQSDEFLAFCGRKRELSAAIAGLHEGICRTEKAIRENNLASSEEPR